MEKRIINQNTEIYSPGLCSGSGLSGYLKLILMITLGLLAFSLSAVNLINENIQNWTAHSSYGTYTQTIPAGDIQMTRCLVSPNAVSNGTCSIGRVQFEASNGVLQFPLLPSVGQVEFHFAAGSAGRSVKLQRFIDSTWVDLIQFTGITATGTTFTYEANLSDSTLLRLALPSHAIYLHDIIITDFQNSDLPIVTTLDIHNITYDTAASGGTIEFGGSSPISAKGVCWSTTPEPDLSDNFTSDGTGINTYNSLITGLTPDTDYFVRAYATNLSGTAYGNELAFRTLNIGMPSTQASELVFYPGNYSIQASWTAGNGARRIVKINTSNNFNLPADGVDYPSNASYSGTGDQVVYNNSTQYVDGEAINAVTVTGLTPGTQYWFRIFDYNGTGPEAIYNVSTALSNPSFTTTLNSVPEGYYDGITGTGTNLKANLHTLISATHLTEFSYDAVWQQLQYTDEDSTNTNNVIETYSGWSVPKGFYGSGSTNWNREHTWSVSHGGFSTAAPAGTDLHHLRPCDVTVNSAKGNKDFDEGGNPYVDASPYPGYNATTGSYADPDSWEPRDVEKGDVARMLLYMCVRYEGTDTSYNLEMDDITPTTGAFYGKLSTLLSWVVTDPPDSWEMRRNNRIQERQGNRNPFIDHPEYATLIWAPSITAPTDVTDTGFTVNWTPALNATAYYLDIATDSLFTSVLPEYQNVNVGNGNSFFVTNLPASTTYYYRLRSFFTSGYGMYCSPAHVIPGPHVELSSFTASENAQHHVELIWVTMSESQIMGYNLYRSESTEIQQADQINISLIAATNTNSAMLYTFTDDEVSPQTTYNYWLKAIYISGLEQVFGPDSVFVHGTDIAGPTLPVAQVLSLNIYPNPFHSRAMIDFSLSKAADVKINIYNLKGQRVKTLLSNSKAAGQHQIVWNGTDIKGKSVAPGIYLIQMKAGKVVLHKKVVVISVK